MKFSFLLIVAIFCSFVHGQTPAGKQRTKKVQAVVPLAEPITMTGVDGAVKGRTYLNSVYGFRITFPDNWLIPGSGFEEYTRSQGFDLGLKTPDNLKGAGKIQLERSLERVKVLVTGYRSVSGTAENAIMRAAVEDLTMTPQVKDAVDYFDLMRNQFAVMKLPADFKYSETQAEKLGAKQFAYLDTWSGAGKKRMYATVRNGYALLFTLSYSRPEDLATMRQILAGGDFKLQNK